MPSTKSPAENSGTTAERYDGFTAQERAAMKEHAREQKKTAARRGSSRAEKEAAAEQDVLAKTAEMPEADRVLAERIHEIVMRRGRARGGCRLRRRERRRVRAGGRRSQRMR